MNKKTIGNLNLYHGDCMDYMKSCKEGYEPHQTNARYFSDFVRQDDWFLSL